ncbi:unnamed protein product [Auanema sp. JU1783]|nr:unnamed protein product [Auanema sp. JU1783]
MMKVVCVVVILLTTVYTSPVNENKHESNARPVRETSSTDEITEQDKQACAELRLEYVKVCAMAGQHLPDEKEREFCAAFENICFRIPNSEPDQATMPKALIKELTPMTSSKLSHDLETFPSKTTTTTTAKPKPKIDIEAFCRDFKNRYLFVCPDPFRFGQKAVVFCPIYSERCHVPLPDRPVVPTRKPPKSRRGGSAVERLCRSYRGFADSYCNNSLLLSQPQYREGCEKYWRFCTHRGNPTYQSEEKMKLPRWVYLLLVVVQCIYAQGPIAPRHYYGAHQGNIRSGVVPFWGGAPVVNQGTLAPHVCGFNAYTRKCMDPENNCPGRCMNFRYTYNVLYDCRCLAL